MAESEVAHRQNLEITIVKNEAREARIGQICALTIGIVAIVAGVVAAAYGAEMPAAVIGGGGVIGLVAVFIWGRKKK